MKTFKNDFFEVTMVGNDCITEILLKPDKKCNDEGEAVLLGQDGIVDLNIWEEVKQAKRFENGCQIIKVLGDERYEKCKTYYITRFIMPKGISQVREGLFSSYGRLNIRTLVWPDKCDKIVEDCLRGARVNNLENIDHVTQIMERAFADSGIETIQWPSKCDTIPRQAFEDSFIHNIENIEHVIRIEPMAFKGCQMLGEFTIPKEVRLIPLSCFSGSGLFKISGQENVIFIHRSAFYQCRLQEFRWPDKCEKVPMCCFANSTALKSVTNLGAVKRIEDSAFSATGITKLEFSKNLTDIAQAAFAYSLLEDIKGLENVETIGGQAFEGTHIKKFIWPPKCQTMKDFMFCYSKLEKIENLQNVVSIGEGVFHMSNIETVDLSDSMCSDIDQCAFIGINPENIKLGYYCKNFDGEDGEPA